MKKGETIGSHPRRCWLVVAVVLSLMALLAPGAAAAKQEATVGPAASRPVIKIGVATWLDEAHEQTWAWGERNAVQLAIDQTNAAGGVRIGRTRYDLALVEANDGCGYGSMATDAATTLVTEGVVAVVGHGCTGAVMAAWKIYNDAGVAMITPSASGTQITGQGSSVTFRLDTNDGVPPALLATYLRQKLGRTRVAIVEDGMWDLAESFTGAFTALGGTVTGWHHVGGPDGDSFKQSLEQALTAIKLENVDAIAYLALAWPIPANAALFTKMVRTQLPASVVVGWNTISNDEADLDAYVSEAGVAASGAVAALQYRRIADMPGWQSFLNDYRAAGFPYASQDPQFTGAYAYDAARLIIAAIRSAQSTDPEVIRNAIAATRNFKGAVGTYDYFDSTGEVAPQWATLERYSGRRWQIIK